MPAAQRSVSFAAILAGLALAVLGALWWRDLGERSRIPSVLLDRLAESAAMIEREIDAEFVNWETMAAGPEEIGGMPASGTLVVYSSRGVMRVRGERPAYYPLVFKSDVPEDERLVRARDAERTRKDLDAAIAAYREAATSTGRTVRAVATAGLGRCLRVQGKLDEALAVYADLATMNEAVVDGIPAPMLAYRERQRIFQEEGDPARSSEEAERLAAALVARELMVQQPAFEVLAPALKVGRFPLEPLARAGALRSIWPRMLDRPAGRAIVRDREATYAGVWRVAGEESHAIVAPVEVLMKRALAAADRIGVTIGLDDEAQNPLRVLKRGRTDSASHSLEGIGLPVTLRLWLKNPEG